MVGWREARYDKEIFPAMASRTNGAGNDSNMPAASAVVRTLAVGTQQ